MAFDPLDRSGWDAEQERLAQRREQIHQDANVMAYQAGRKRGSRGDIDVPSWMAHLSEIAPTMANPDQFAAAHRYGQVESYTEHAPDMIEDEFRPRAEKIAKSVEGLANQAGNAATALKARGIIAAAGRSRYPLAPTFRRARIANERLAQAQGHADALQAELRGRLDAVDALHESLGRSIWKPPHAS